MTKQQWLMQLRRCRKISTLEAVIGKKTHELSGHDLAVFWGAADHRLAELLTEQLYDKVPREKWRQVR